MSDHKKPAAATIAAAMLGIEHGQFGDIAPALRPSTTYETGEGFEYYRADGPTLRDVEAVLANLENGTDALAFSSGMAAATNLLIALGPGCHIAAPETMYWYLRSWMMGKGNAFGLQVTLYRNDDLAALKAAIRPGETKAIWVETPANADWAVTDIAAAADLAHNAGAQLFIDSTAATPILTRPLDLGADVVMHSATKYLNGHSDVLSGVLVTKDADGAFWSDVKAARSGMGATLGAFEAWLLLRGLRTLDVRVRRHSENAMTLATALKGNPNVSHVLYPGLSDHPGHDVAAKQMQGGFGGMMSIRLKGGFDAAAKAADKTCLFRKATSLGGTESLIEHRQPVEGPNSVTPPDLLRLSVGLEDACDLLADLEYAIV